MLLSCPGWKVGKVRAVAVVDFDIAMLILQWHKKKDLWAVLSGVIKKEGGGEGTGCL